MPADADLATPREHDSRRPLRHPAQAFYAALGLPDGLPTLDRLNAVARERHLAHADGRRLVFVAAGRPQAAIAYERRIAERGEIPIRHGNLHDAWNARAWLAFPRSKAALNAIHVAAGLEASPKGRGRRRDAATLFDESGLIAAAVDREFVDRWRAHAWRDAFGVSAEALRQSVAVVVVGHGLLARLERPFAGLTAKALLLALAPALLPAAPEARARALDAAVAARLGDARRGLDPADLLPLPLAALAEWDTGPLGERRFDDLSVFRPRRAGNDVGFADGCSRPESGHANVIGR